MTVHILDTYNGIGSVLFKGKLSHIIFEMFLAPVRIQLFQDNTVTAIPAARIKEGEQASFSILWMF